MKYDDLLRTARDRMSDVVSAENFNRLEDLDDLQKLVGRQWDREDLVERDADGKPSFTINRLPQFVRQVTGDLRRMNPAIKVLPSDEQASAEIAEIYEGVIRQIEYASDASTIYERAAEQAAASSIGYFRILTQYESENSFLQEIRIKSIRNPMSVYFDPAAELPTREDADYCFITEQIPTEEFDRRYPGKSHSTAPHDGRTDGLEHWQTTADVTIAEYYWKEPVKRKIAMLEDGSVMAASEVPEGIEPVKTRTVESHKVKWAKISGTDVLEGPLDVPCKYIPVIAVVGEEWHVGGRVHRSSVIRYAKDSQQIYNYAISAQTEIVAIQPKSPYLVTAGEIAGFEQFWNEANAKNRPYLPFNPDPKMGGRPQRMPPPVSSPAMYDLARMAADDMKATTGIYDSALGAASREQSGVAIRQRQMESDVSTSIYADNMAKAIGTAGRIIVDMIPKIYDTARSIRILGKDDSDQMIQINGKMMSQQGEMPINDLTLGRYDVRVSVGPNYATRRQETAEGMLEFMRVVPGAAQVTGDLLAKAMDWPDADQFAERLKKTLPPQFTDQDDLSPEEQQQMKAAMAKAQQAERMQQIATQAELRKLAAEATEAEADAVEAQADAEKAQIEVASEQIELAAKTGELDAAIGQIVQNHVTMAIKQLMQQGQRPRF